MASRATIFRLSLALLVLAGCALAAPPAMAQTAAPGTVPCPASGVSVTRSDGATVRYMGIDPSVANLCLSSVNGTSSRLLFSIFGVPPNMPPGTVADARTALATVLAGPAGTEASFTTRVLDNGFTAQRISVQWCVTCVNQGTDPVTVAGTTYQAIKLQRNTQVTTVSHSTAYHARSDYWIDPKTGIVLKYDYHVIAGPYSPPASWIATAITL
jgi:hypothetical protein